MTMILQNLIDTGHRVAQPHAVTISDEALASVPIGRIFAQQGDIYIRKLAHIPEQAQRDTHATGQLAPGSTQGSRHCVDPTAVALFVQRNASALEGPILQATNTFTITHPEHGHIILPPGIYHVVYQRAFADELRRIAD